MGEHDEIRELLGSYVLGHLDAQDRARVEAALEADAQLRVEAQELREVADLLPLLETEDLDPAGPVSEVADDLAAAVLRTLATDAHAEAAASDQRDQTDPPHPTDETGTADRTAGEGRTADEVTPLRRSRNRWGIAGLAASLVALMVAGGVILVGGDDEPGLGVEEPVAFEVAVDTVEVEASVVPHTWGTEVFLTMDGLIDGELYYVDLAGSDGESVSAGTFIGDAELEVVCIMNGAMLREDVAEIVISTADGEQVMRAELDEVAYRSV